MKVNTLNEYDKVKTQDKSNNIKQIHENAPTESLAFHAMYTKGEEYQIPAASGYEDAGKKEEKGLSDPKDLSCEKKWKNQSASLLPEDLEALAKEGIPAEEQEVDDLEKNLERIKRERADKNKSLENQVQHIEEKYKQIEDIGRKRIIDKLEEANLPVTEENISRIASLLEMASVMDSMSDKSYHYMIQNQLEPTIPNLYKASYGGGYSLGQPLSKEVYKELEKNIKEIIENSFIEDKNKGLDMAKWLLDHNLPVTKDNLFGLENLEELKENYNKGDILNGLIEALGKGEPLEEVIMGTGYEERAKRAVELLHNMDIENLSLSLSNLEEKKEPVTLWNLHKELNSKKEGAASSFETVRVRRQLEELRLKMTVESGARLLKQGISIETTKLSTLVDELKAMENAYYKQILSSDSNIVTGDNNENLKVLTDVMAGVGFLRTSSAYLLGSTLFVGRESTIESLKTEGEKLHNQLLHAREAYEPLLTAPRSDLGDSIKKAFRNIPDILKEMDLSATADNERAVRILGYNRMDITNETIDKVKAYDKEVNYMLKNLHPKVAAALIKENINPIHMPIHELNQRIEEIRENTGIKEEEKYSKFLYKMEKEHGITKEEKKSFIGIYRLLHNLTKTDGGALGYVINTGKEVTLNNLLSGIRTLKSNGISADIDDTYGSLQEIRYKKEGIGEQIQSAFSQPLSDKDIYMSHILKDLKEEITPSALRNLNTAPLDIADIPIEELYDRVSGEEDGEDSEYFRVKRDEYVDAIKNSGEEIAFLEAIKEEVTIENLYYTKDFFSDKDSIWQRIKRQASYMKEEQAASKEQLEISETIMDGIKSPKDMEEAYEKTRYRINKYLEKLYENPDITSYDVMELKRISGGMGFVNNMAKRECYEIPLLIKDEITNVNLTIVHKGLSTGKISLKTSLPAIGDISIKLFVNSGGIKGLIGTQSKYGYEEIKDSQEMLRQELKSLGIKDIDLSVTMDAKEIASLGKQLLPDVSEAKEEVSEKADTKELYSIAKSFLVYLKEVESLSVM